jgi:aspartate-semialdehyde dehydrogenase
MSPDEARRAFAEVPGVVVMDDPENHVYPLATQAAGKDEVFVGRIRTDPSVENGLAFWVVSDNLRKGAATNAIEIAEVLLDRGWVQARSRRELQTGAGEVS